MLDGREYGEVLSEEEEAQAKAANLVVVFGYSDDNAEFRGAINDEIGAYDKTKLYINHDGLIPSHDEDDCECPFCGYGQAIKSALVIEANFSINGWTFKTSIPHAKFVIKEEGEQYGEGIVFEFKPQSTQI